MMLGDQGRSLSFLDWSALTKQEQTTQEKKKMAFEKWWQKPLSPNPSENHILLQPWQAHKKTGEPTLPWVCWMNEWTEAVNPFLFLRHLCIPFFNLQLIYAKNVLNIDQSPPSITLIIRRKKKAVSIVTSAVWGNPSNTLSTKEH